MPPDLRAVILMALFCVSLPAQSTQGLLSGRVLNSVTGRAVPDATVTYSSDATLAGGNPVHSDAQGSYFVPLLSAGTYSVRVTANGFQSAEVRELELAVAGRLQVDVRLRPLSDVWEAGQFRSIFLPGTKTVVNFYGPDVDPSHSGTFEAIRGQSGTLDTSASYVIDTDQLQRLPLAGRDVYTMLVSLPNVTADNATSRGLGLSIAGQRPSASNYLLDGVENNNYLITGPLNPVAPEAIGEYRVSTNNYSAEFGRTGGFVANAITRAGTRQYHGVAYGYIKNDALNAANFADNANGIERRPAKEYQFGFQAGGPVIPGGDLRNRLFFSSALEQLISHSAQDPQTYLLPTANFITALALPSDRIARQLLEKYPSPLGNSASNLLVDSYTTAQPVIVDRTVAIERGDYASKSGRDRFLARLALNRVTEPDFIWSPYSDFISPLHQNTWALMGNWMRTWTPRVTSELKFSYSGDTLFWDRAHAEIPTLTASDGTTLPGSPAFYGYQNQNRVIETIFNTVWTPGRHVLSAGVGALFRRNEGYLTAGRDGQYIFSRATNFAFDRPQFFRAAVDRLATNPVQPDYAREYGYAEAYAFLQDSFRVSNRFTWNYGLRYERYGAPVNIGGTKDILVQLDKSPDPTTNVAASRLLRPASGDQSLYGTDSSDWAVRTGFAFDLGSKRQNGVHTVLRGGYGIYYDRPFDNLWQNIRNNAYSLPIYSIASNSFNYLQPINSVLSTYSRQTNVDFPSLTMVDPSLRNGYVQDLFLGIQQRLTDSLSAEINGTGALGRRLITTDIINRQFTTSTGTGRPNETLPDVAYRASQGISDYYALSALVRYRVRGFTAQGAYTWSHSIDTQSEPLLGDFFDLSYTNLGGASTAAGARAAFTRQYDSRGDRASSDFDQRHNLFLWGIWESAGRRWFNAGWTVSGLAAFRSGFPFTVSSVVTAPPAFGSGLVENQRADLVNPSSAMYAQRAAAPGGVYLLNPAAFGYPASDSVPGSSGRNAFRGPGLYSADMSLARTFALRGLPSENVRLRVRADAFNVLNHANLNNPNSLFGSPGFGLATYGRQGLPSGFPAVAPLNETARQIQLSFRLEF